MDGDDVGMDERGCGACLADEPLPVDGVVNLIGAEDLEGDAAVEAGVPGFVDHAHAALTDLGFDAIMGEHFAFVEVLKSGSDAIESGEQWIFERLALGIQKLLDFGAKVGVGAAVLLEEFEALGIAQLERGTEDFLDAGVALGCHFPALAEISTRSQALAMAHSRLTVRGAMPMTSAVSSTVMPPK